MSLNHNSHNLQTSSYFHLLIIQDPLIFRYYRWEKSISYKPNNQLLNIDNGGVVLCNLLLCGAVNSIY